MKKMLITAMIISVFAVPSFAFQEADNSEEKEAVKKVVSEFVDGCYNRFDEEAVINTMHPDYMRLGLNNNRLRANSRYSFLNFIKTTQLTRPDWKIGETWKFAKVDVAGNVGFADADLFWKGGQGKDYFLLLKFNEGWRIVESIDQEISDKIRAATEAEIEKEKEAVKKVIQDAYVDGLQNWGDTEVIRKGIHPRFNMLRIRNNKLYRSKLDGWIKNVEKRKKENPGGPEEKRSVKFLDVRVTGSIGYAKFETYAGTKLNFIDVMFLLKFKDEWRIVAKAFHKVGSR